MNQIIFATNNKHKLEEIKRIINNKIKILSLEDIKCFEEIPETGNTLDANALQKARFIYDKYNINCFADDTGLEIEALNGDPGVYSARYAGEAKSFDDNMNKVLDEMDGMSDRKACFRTVIALIIDGKESLFEGRVEGTILTLKQGTNGFGYDPIFKPSGYDLSFAQMNAEQKNSISHRFFAIDKMIKSGLLFL
jgi:XTP/dITP diphosphohydrolase